MHILSKPIYVKKIWGGTKIFEYFSRHLISDAHIGESFELSGLPDGIISIGGENTALPLVIKYIDANRNLSLQVHPQIDKDGYHRKFEVWYILDALPESRIFCGWNRKVTKEMVERGIKEHTISELMNEYYVKPGDFFVIPPGTVHSIGKGILLYEAQNTCADTLRLYDWDRGRKLQLAEALDMMSVRPSNNIVRNISNIYKLETNFFDITIFDCKADRIEKVIQYGVITVLSGEIIVGNDVFKKGNTVLIENNENVILSQESMAVLLDDYK